MTDHYALFGNPVKHSPSPQVHTDFAKQTQQDMVYEKKLIPLEAFKKKVKEFQQQGGKGLNITVPFKQQAYDLCDARSERGEAAKAINTIKFLEDGRIYGDNTDGFGLIRDITHNHGFPIRDKKVLLLGAGGAARGVIKPIMDESPQQLIIANRTSEKAIALALEFEKVGPIVGYGFDNLRGKQFDLIINATSASLQGASLPLPEGIIAAEGCCYDMVYGDQLTPFLSWCKAQGASLILDGIGMLLEQAAESFTLWRGIRPQTKPLLERFRK